MVRHYTSRAGDPHRHLHLQVNARVFAAGRWRGLHSVGVVDSIEAINGIGHAAVDVRPRSSGTRSPHTATPSTPTPARSPSSRPYVGAFSARASQITRNLDRYEAEWRAEHPGEEPGPGLRRAWDRRAWAQARPDKVVPKDGAQLAERWREELPDLGFTPPPLRTAPVSAGTAVDRLGTPIGRIDRDAVVRPGADSAGCPAVELERRRHPRRGRADRRRQPTSSPPRRCAASWSRTSPPAPSRSVCRCWPAATCPSTSAPSPPAGPRRRGRPGRPARRPRRTPGTAGPHRSAASPPPIGWTTPSSGWSPRWSAPARLLVVEGAAGAGKTTTLAAARQLLEPAGRRLVVVTPTLKAARVAGAPGRRATRSPPPGWSTSTATGGTTTATGPAPRPSRTSGRGCCPVTCCWSTRPGCSTRTPPARCSPSPTRPAPRLALVGDRHQLPAVGRGGVLDHAARWVPPEARLALETVHRFTDPDYADLSLLMRTGERSGEVFDALVSRGQIVVHATEVERHQALTSADGLVVADTREQVAALNAAIRDHRLTTGLTTRLTTSRRTGPFRRSPPRRRADRGRGPDRDPPQRPRPRRRQPRHLDRHRHRRRRRPRRHRPRRSSGPCPRRTCAPHVELAYATTVHGAQGETVDHAHLLLGETTGAAAAYVAHDPRPAHQHRPPRRRHPRGRPRPVDRDLQPRPRRPRTPHTPPRPPPEDIDRYGPTAPRRSRRAPVHAPARLARHTAGPRAAPSDERARPHPASATDSHQRARPSNVTSTPVAKGQEPSRDYKLSDTKCHPVSESHAPRRAYSSRGPRAEPPDLPGGTRQ